MLVQINENVSFEETAELKEQVYQKVLEWFIEQGHFSGEGIMQADDPIINAPVLLSDIADDLFKFKYIS
ncbi:MAG: hypothetical protein ABIP51_18275 [Bacteroidia bacterium]